MNEVEQRLRQMVTGLEDRHFSRLDVPLTELLSHTLLQGVAAAAMRLNPDLSRAALMSGPTWNDVFAWLAQVGDSTDAVTADQSDRPSRGSYQSSNTTLRALIPPDIDALYRASVDPRLNHRWRFRGRTPAPGEFHQILYAPEVFCQFMVAEAASGRSVGLVAAYNAEYVAGHATIAVQRLLPQEAPPESGGLMIEGFFVFIQYLFDHFNFAKLYLEVPEYNLSLFDSGPRSMLEVEGRLRNHYYWGDRHWDLFYLAFYRERWEEIADLFRGTWPAGHFASAAEEGEERSVPRP